MDLRERYRAELARRSDGSLLDLSPSQLAEAACVVVGADGGGVVMAHELLRLPVGATDEDSRVAEELQASLGAGPCLTAATTGAVVAAGEADMAARWPPYHQALRARTRFRSTLSFPLRRLDGAGFAALNLYSADPHWRPADGPATIQAGVADVMSALLRGAPDDADDLPPGSDQAQVDRRQRVWVAVGQIMEAGDVDDADAIALLRGYAFRNDTLLDDVAERLVGREITSADVLAPDEVP